MRKIILLKNKTTPTDLYETYFSSNAFQPVFIPLIKHTHIPSETLELLQDNEYLTDLRYIIITSQRTVECLNESIIPKLSMEHRELLLSKVIYTVGPATQRFLKNCGFKDVRGGEETGNGSLLADYIAEQLLVQPNREPSTYGHLLFLVGEIRRDIIPKKLAAVGLNVKEVVTYKTEDLEDNLTRFRSVCDAGSWVVIFSPQGTKDILEYLKVTNTTRVVSIGPTTQKYLESNGLKPDLVSSKPEPVSLLKEIKNDAVSFC